MSFTGILREIERANRRALREQARKQKEIQKQQAAYIRAYQMKERNNYLNCQQEKADNMTKQIISQYEKYKNIGNVLLSVPRFFSFEDYKKKYVEMEFSYNEPRPVKREKSKLVKVPNEIKIEKTFPFLRKIRLSLEAKKKTMEEEELQEYNLSLKRYEQSRKEAKKFLIFKNLPREKTLNLTIIQLMSGKRDVKTLTKNR